MKLKAIEGTNGMVVMRNQRTGLHEKFPEGTVVRAHALKYERDGFCVVIFEGVARDDYYEVDRDSLPGTGHFFIDEE